MKQRILLGAAAWTALITLLHVALNVGFDSLVNDVRVMLGQRRPTLKVGFLPVT